MIEIGEGDNYNKKREKNELGPVQQKTGYQPQTESNEEDILQRGEDILRTLDDCTRDLTRPLTRDWRRTGSEESTIDEETQRIK